MNHIARLYHIIYINPPPEILAQQLGYGIWTLCSAFRYGDLVLLNDSECDKGTQEYAVIRIDDLDALDDGLLVGTQIETLAVSHLNTAQLRVLIADLNKNARWYPALARIEINIDLEHHNCCLCG